jgi:hypothetical protein
VNRSESTGQGKAISVASAIYAKQAPRLLPGLISNSKGSASPIAPCSPPLWPPSILRIICGPLLDFASIDL